MLRWILISISVFCVSTLVMQASAGAILWYRDQLSAETIKEIGLILSGNQIDELEVNDGTEESQESVESVIRDRSMRILDLETRESELKILKEMVHLKAAELRKQQQDFDENRVKFQNELKVLEEKFNSNATKQARNILAQLRPEAAVNHLMTLDKDESLLLLRGMQKKEIAKILEAFAREDQTKARGLELFDSLSSGGLEAERVSDALESTRS